MCMALALGCFGKIQYLAPRAKSRLQKKDARFAVHVAVSRPVEMASNSPKVMFKAANSMDAQVKCTIDISIPRSMEHGQHTRTEQGSFRSRPLVTEVPDASRQMCLHMLKQSQAS